jgi:hypothetical protein
MPTVPIKDLGKGGVVKDTAAALLPENIMTDALNVRFLNGSIESILGESVLFNAANVNPEYGIHWRRPDASYSVLMKDGKVVAKAAGGTETVMLNSVDAKYSASIWQVDSFGGGYAIIINNGKSTPMYVLYGDPVANFTMTEFPGWNYLAGNTITAKVVRPFGYSLVAANLKFNDGVTTTEAPVTVRVSTQAVIGGFPQVWQPGLTTDTADEFEVNSKSAIQDLCELRGNMMIYCYDSIHLMSNNNGVYSVRPYIQGYGILNQGCVTEFENQHFVVDRNDIYVHNGSGQVQSVAEGRVKRFFFEAVNTNAYEKVFVTKNAKYKEIWVCYPSHASTGKCDKVMIWNYTDNTWTFRDLPELLSMFISPRIVSGAFKYVTGDTILGCGSTSRVLLMDDTNQMVTPSTGVPYNPVSYVIREKLFAGDPLGDNTIVSLSPVVQTSNTDTTVTVTVNGQNIYDKSPDFANTTGRDAHTLKPKDEKAGYKVDLRETGRFINLKISADGYWRLSFMGLGLNAAGRR